MSSFVNVADDGRTVAKTRRTLWRVYIRGMQKLLQTCRIYKNIESEAIVDTLYEAGSSKINKPKQKQDVKF